MNSIWSVARTNPMSIKIGTGTDARCGVLTFAVATRIAIPGLRIDLPVIKPGSGYPLCNVAMYLKELSQPREAGVTLIYAHARKGMFLPLLERSRINNGASLIGATVKVWTSNDVVSTYRITRVRRHVTSLDGVFDIGAEQLWIQTSEGPRGTVAKLVVVAKRIGYEAAAATEGHPTPHPVRCA
jgi:sortase (surface protein transpeptidase)